MKSILAAGVLALSALFTAPVAAQDDKELDALIQKLNREIDGLQKEVDRLQKQVQDLTDQLKEKIDPLNERFERPFENPFEGMDLEEMLKQFGGRFDGEMPDFEELMKKFEGRFKGLEDFEGLEDLDLNELLQRFNERFGDMDLHKLFDQFKDSFGDRFDLEGALEQFRDIDPQDLERMMEPFRKMMEPQEQSQDDEVI